MDSHFASLSLADERTLESLDFPAIRERLARHAMTERAAARARCLRPSSDFMLVRLEQAATAEMRALEAQTPLALPRIAETEDATARAAQGSSLSAEELRTIGAALAAAEASVRRVRDCEAPTLRARCAGAAMLEQITAAIEHAIGERGEILDRASPALARIRKSIVQAHEEARARCQAIVRSSANAKIVQDAIVTMRDGRFVIPIKAECNGQIPGIVHDTSSTGHTLFIEPLSALDANNRVRTLRLEEEHEIARILRELSARVGARAEAVEGNIEILADLDMIAARAHLAETMRAVAPRLVDEARLEIKRGRHPLLGERAVPQSLELDDERRFIVISGPNMGGKTVSLKMSGMFVAMTACGMHLPADEGTVVGHFTRVGADIGDAQSIERNVSTFSSHLDRLRELLAQADARSLILIDEIASGTEPASSAALGIALIEHLLARGARGIVTTHATELKLFAHEHLGVRNASVRFDPQTNRPTFELDMGAPGRSLAFPLARALGLPEALIARAETLLSESERSYDRALSELAEAQASTRMEREALAQERAETLALQERAREQAEALERERRAFAQAADEKLTRALREFISELERRNALRPARARVTQGQAALLDRAMETLHGELDVRSSVSSAAPPREQERLKVGDTVRVEAFGSEGTVVADYGDTVLVAVGAMQSVVPKLQVRAIHQGGGRKKQRSASPERARVSLEAAASASQELDVRGKRYAEAEPLVEAWIDEASLLGLPRLRLIHGKGTGLLGKGLQELLKGHPAVKSLRYGSLDEGGSGVTVLELR